MADDELPPEDAATPPLPPPPPPPPPPAYPGYPSSEHSLAGMEPMPPVSSSLAYDRFRAQLEIDGPARQRRWTVALRVVLLLPLVPVMLLLGLASVVVVVVSWFCALVLGRVPHWAAGFFVGYLAWSTRVSAYSMLLTDRYPGLSFAPDAGAVRTEVRAERVNRWLVLVRAFYLMPASLMAQFLALGWALLSLPFWLIVLVRGRMPSALFAATAAVQRVQLRLAANQFMLTDAYPLVQVFGDPLPLGQHPAADTEDAAAEPVIRTRPLHLSRAAKILLSVFIALGVVGFVAEVALEVARDVQLQSLDAATDTYRARNDFSNQYVDEIHALEKCSGRLDCLQQSFERIGKDADEFVRKIDAIDYPEEVWNDVDVLDAEGKNLAATARRIAKAPVNRYDQVLHGSRIDDQAVRVIDDATALGKRLD